MRTLTSKLKQRLLAARNRSGEAGQGIVEYLIIIAFVGLAVVLIVNVMGPVISNVFADFVESAPLAPPDLVGFTRIPPTVTPTPNSNPILTLTVVDGSSGGSGSTITPTGCTATGTPNQYRCTFGQTYQLDAVAGAGYQFTGWGDDLSGAATPGFITMDGNKTVSANFSLIQYTLTVNLFGSGTVNVDGTLYNSPVTFSPGATPNIQAVPDPGGYLFLQWSGDLTGSNVNETLTMDSDKTVTAFFQVGCYDLTLQNLNSAGGSVTSSPSPNCSGQYIHGTNVSLTASPAAGYNFAGWGGALSGTNLSTSLLMDAAKTVTADFSVIQYTLTVTPTGGGTVSISPNQPFYLVNDQVTLTANPDPGKVFSNWSGDITGSSSPYSLTMDGDKDIVATFADACYTLTIGNLPTNSGSVSTNPASSGGCPNGQYVYNTDVTLTASGAAGYDFDRWSGDISGTNSLALVTMNTDKNITANFVACYSLNLNADPQGSGIINPDIAANCNNGTDYRAGTVLTLTATANPGYTFQGWRDDLNGNSNPETLVMDGNKTVTARFR